MQKEQLEKEKLKIVNQSRESNIQPLGITQKAERKQMRRKQKIAQENSLGISGGLDLQLKEGIGCHEQ